jgi:phosphate-selective porin OprO/OprP
MTSIIPIRRFAVRVLFCLFLFVVFGSCLFVVPVNATVELEKRIEFLEKELSFLKQELDAVKAQLKISSDSAKISPKKTVRSGPTLKGRFLQDYAAFSTDGQMESGLNPSTKTASSLRTSRLEVTGRYDEKLSYKFQYDFSESTEVEPKQIALKYRGDSKRALLIGHLKEPFGLENLTSGKYRTFMEQGVSALFSPGYNTGFSITDENPDRPFFWSFGIFKDDRANDAKTGLVGTANWNKTLRGVYTPVYENQGRRVLHLGSAYSYRNSNSTNIRFRVRPESSLWSLNFVDTGNIAAHNADLGGMEFAWVNGPFSLQAESVLADVSSMTNGKHSFSGYYVMASYFLTGEYRQYNRESRSFSAVRPEKSYTDGGRGAWELAARYSEVDLNDGPVSGGELSNWTLGLNWIPTRETRVVWNYINSDLKNGGNAESLNMRLQFEF